MEQWDTQWNRIFRKREICMILIGIGIYIWWLTTWYLSPIRNYRMFTTALLYISMHYVAISWYDLVYKYKWRLTIFISIICIGIGIYTKNLRLFISVILWHVAIVSTLYTLNWVLKTNIVFRKTIFFRAWGWLFTVFFTMSFISAFIWRNNEFTLTCSDIMAASNAVINYTEKKFNIGIEQINQWKWNIIDMLIGTGGSSILGSDTLDSSILDSDTLDSTIQQHSTLFESLLSWSNYSSTGNTYWDDTTSAVNSIAGILHTYKTSLIDIAISNQKDVNMKICHVFIDQIERLYTQPSFRMSVIILMFFFISPLLRVTLFIISSINILLFIILKRCGVYKIEKVTVEADKIV